MRKALFILALLPLMASTCRREAQPDTGAAKSIVILYENDVHCSIGGYARLAGLKEAILAADTAWVATVSSGDFLQGSSSGALSRGQYIVDIMKAVGYDAIALGNHEFDYGVDRQMELLPQLNTPVLCANFFQCGASTPMYDAYTIKSLGNHQVAFVGALTAQAMINESYSFYDREGNQLYDLRPDETIPLVQAAVDQARSQGADYVVVLSHLGEYQQSLGITSHRLLAATRGIDALLDGHTHSAIVRDEVANLDGVPVPVSETGTRFAYVGKLVISADGRISTSLIPIEDIPYVSEKVQAATDSVNRTLALKTARVVAHTDYDLTVDDENGRRRVRSGETNMGDLVTDAFRQVMGAQIGLCNGGGIRASIPAGDITYGNVTDVQPFDNHMALIRATGADILNMLEHCTASYPEEDGQFPLVSGLCFTLHPQDHSISDVAVWDDASGTWEALAADGRYTIALSDYYMGGGFYDTLKDSELLVHSTLFTRDALALYLENTLGGTVPDIYERSQGRVKVE